MVAVQFVFQWNVDTVRLYTSENKGRVSEGLNEDTEVYVQRWRSLMMPVVYAFWGFSGARGCKREGGLLLLGSLRTK